MTKRTHRKYNAEYKLKLLKEHLVNQVSVSELCEKENLKPSLFYKWQQELFKNGQLVFEGQKRVKHQDSYQRKIASLEAKLREKDEVLAEVMQEYVTLKKTRGEE